MRNITSSRNVIKYLGECGYFYLYVYDSDVLFRLIYTKVQKSVLYWKWILELVLYLLALSNCIVWQLITLAGNIIQNIILFFNT